MIAIGGIGGSGTRVIAQVLKDVGYFIGNDLNISNDNLLFTLLFKRVDILVASNREISTLWQIFLKLTKQNDELDFEEIRLLEKLSDFDRPQHDVSWLKERLKHLRHDIETSHIAFKEPNSHIVIERLLAIESNLKFIYVYRNGLDMAYSSNQNQLSLWGSIYLGEENLQVTPKNSLKYWCRVHKRMIGLNKDYSDRIFLLDFDKLCFEPQKYINKISDFLCLNKFSTNIFDFIKVSSSIGRHKEFDLSDFDKSDVDYALTVCAH